MAKFSLKDTIGYKYDCVWGDCIIVEQITEYVLKVKLLDAPTFQSGAHPEWDKGYASITVQSMINRPKTSYVNESLTLERLLKLVLTLHH